MGSADDRTREWDACIIHPRQLLIRLADYAAMACALAPGNLDVHMCQGGRAGLRR